MNSLKTHNLKPGDVTCVPSADDPPQRCARTGPVKQESPAPIRIRSYYTSTPNCPEGSEAGPCDSDAGGGPGGRMGHRDAAGPGKAEKRRSVFARARGRMGVARTGWGERCALRESSAGIGPRAAMVSGGEFRARDGLRCAGCGQGGPAFSRSGYCSRSIRRSWSRGLPPTGSAISSRMRPCSASVSRQNRWR